MFTSTSRKAPAAPRAQISAAARPSSSSSSSQRAQPLDAINDTMNAIAHAEADWRSKPLKRRPHEALVPSAPKKRAKTTPKAASADDIEAVEPLLRPPSRPYILDVPAEVLFQIASRLTTREHIRMTRVCRQWKKSLRSMPRLWARLDILIRKSRAGTPGPWLQQLLGLADGKLESLTWHGPVKKLLMVLPMLQGAAQYGFKASLRSLKFSFTDDCSQAPIDSMTLVQNLGYLIAACAPGLRHLDVAVRPAQSLQCLAFPKDDWPTFANLQTLVLAPGDNWHSLLAHLVAPLKTANVVTLLPAHFLQLLARNKETLRDVTVGVVTREEDRPHCKLEVPATELPELRHVSLLAPSVTMSPPGALSAPALHTLCVSELSKVRLFSAGSLAGLRILALSSEHHLLATILDDVPGLEELRFVGSGLAAVDLKPLHDSMAARQLERLEIKAFGSETEGLGEALVNIVDARRYGALGYSMEQILELRERRARRAARLATKGRGALGGAMGGGRKGAASTSASSAAACETEDDVEAGLQPTSEQPLCSTIKSIVLSGQHNVSRDVIAYLNRHLAEPIQA